MHDAGKEYHYGPYLKLMLWSLSNVDGDGKENGKKNNRSRLAKQQLCSFITLFLHFFAVTARLRRKMSNFTARGGLEHKTTTFFFFS